MSPVKDVYPVLRREIAWRWHRVTLMEDDTVEGGRIKMIRGPSSTAVHYHHHLQHPPSVMNRFFLTYPSLR